MAVLSEGGNEYEVRVSLYPEYVKLGDREKPSATECTRYITPQPGNVYEVTITLRKGFSLGKYDHLEAFLHFGGQSHYIANKSVSIGMIGNKPISRDYQIVFNCINRKIRGVGAIGATFRFGSLDIDDQLSDETNVLNVDPSNLGGVMIRLFRCTGNSISTPETEADVPGIWEATKVDQKSFKKHGISYTTRLDGLHDAHLAQVQPPTRFREQLATQGPVLRFHYFFRRHEYLQSLDIVPFPPPLYHFSWNELNNPERKVAFNELQALNKVQDNLESSANSSSQQPEVWQSWNSMDVWKRKQIFEELQRSHKTFERSEVLQQLAETPSSRILDLENNAVAPNSDVTGTRQTPIDMAPPDNMSLPRKRPRSSSMASPVTLKREFRGPGTQLGSAAGSSIKSESKIKLEPIDVDALEEDEITIFPRQTIKHEYDLTLNEEEEDDWENKVKVEITIEEDIETLNEIMDDPPTKDTSLTEEEQRWLQEEKEEMERVEMERAEMEQRLAAFRQDSDED